MSDWESDRHPGWGSEPENPESGAKRPEGSRRKPAMPPESARDWKLIEKLVMSLQSEQRKSRRWGIFFKLLTFGYLFALLLMIQFPLSGALESAAKEIGRASCRERV